MNWVPTTSATCMSGMLRWHQFSPSFQLVQMFSWEKDKWLWARNFSFSLFQELERYLLAFVCSIAGWSYRYACFEASFNTLIFAFPLEFHCKMMRSLNLLIIQKRGRLVAPPVGYCRSYVLAEVGWRNRKLCSLGSRISTFELNSYQRS